MGPFCCKSDINKKTTLNVWGVVIQDVFSGAVHIDIMDYSALSVLVMLKRFAALRGWPTKIMSHPGTQLESASGTLTTWWKELEDPLREAAHQHGFTWDINPANITTLGGRGRWNLG